MIDLLLIRKTPKDINQKFTHGELFIKMSSGEYKDFCYTLEDKIRDINMNGKFDNGEKKVYGETAIPFDTYDVELTYSPAFKRMLPLVKNVKEFEGIRIHRLNNIKQTLGCIGVGYKTNWKGNIWKSADAEIDLVNIFENNGKKGTIKII